MRFITCDNLDQPSLLSVVDTLKAKSQPRLVSPKAASNGEDLTVVKEKPVAHASEEPMEVDVGDLHREAGNDTDSTVEVKTTHHCCMYSRPFSSFSLPFFLQKNDSKSQNHRTCSPAGVFSRSSILAVPKKARRTI